jgi:CO/xanthine dehydrogenase FAD-binding subunit
VDACLTGVWPEERVIDGVARAYAEAARAITDVWASAEYRRAMVEVLVRRGIRKLLGEESKA